MSSTTGMDKPLSKEMTATSEPNTAEGELEFITGTDVDPALRSKMSLVNEVRRAAFREPASGSHANESRPLMR